MLCVPQGGWPSPFMFNASGKVMNLWSLCRGRTGQLDVAHRILSVETGKGEVFQEVLSVQHAELRSPSALSWGLGGMLRV